MIDIDFLPASYREAASKRRAHTWRVVVALAFVGLLVAGMIGLSGRHTGMEQELATVRLQYDAAQAEANRLTKLQQDLKPLRAEARLLTYLRHPWPTTRIVASLLAPLPDSIMLRKLQLRRENVPHAAAAPAAIKETPSTEPPELPPPAEQDLARLESQESGTNLVVTLEGTTREIAPLHAYMGKLASLDMFERVELASVEGLRDSETGASSFVIRLVVSPSYGQPGGPKFPADAGKTAASPLAQDTVPEAAL